MRCSFCCIADSLNLSFLSKEYTNKDIKNNKYDELLHVQIQRNDKKIDIFYFNFGSVVFWGADKRKRRPC